MKILFAYLLLAIAVAMIVISIQGKILPPGLTGIGFILIAILYLKKE